MSMTLVSVIIPNYNHAKYLDERIQSVLNQTYQDFELIILDDCSPDNGASRSIIEKYRHNPHVSHIVYNEVNSGSAFKQWHKGFGLAKGDLIWIAESDDSCAPEFLETLVHGYLEHHAVLAFCRSERYGINGNKELLLLQTNLRHDITISGRDFISTYMIDRNSVANASSAIFNREVALKVDRRYMTLQGEGDWLFWIEIMEYGNVFFCTKALNYYRWHGLNTTMNLAVSGIGDIEHKIFFDFLVNCKYIPSHLIFEKKIAYISKMLHSDYFESKTVKSRALNVWDKYRFYRLYILLRDVKYAIILFLKNII